MIMQTDLKQLEESLNYLHVGELKTYCEKLALSSKGKKPALVACIVHFVRTGEKTTLPHYPAVSCAKKSAIPPLQKDSRMLKSAYKNDLKTRLFFKVLIGEYFHFTAFGIDWLEERWMQDKPPTYQAFATMWKKEYAFRKAYGSEPKQEWAYIRFVKDYLKSVPEAAAKVFLSA